MLKRYGLVLILAALMGLALLASAKAAPLAAECNVSMPCIGAADGAITSDRGGGVIGGRPAECRVAIRGRLIPWCGCWLGVHLNELDPSLWVARNWARVGSRARGPCVGCVAVWRHHVGIVQAVDGNQIKLLSGNDGGKVRERWRSVQGVIAWRMI